MRLKTLVQAFTVGVVLLVELVGWAGKETMRLVALTRDTVGTGDAFARIWGIGHKCTAQVHTVFP